MSSTSALKNTLIYGVIIMALLSFSMFTLNSIVPEIFPVYYGYVIFGFLFYLLLSRVDFSVLSLFSTHLYVGSMILLLLPVIIGQVTRGTVRWIPVGPVNIQPAELARPFLYLFFANELAGKEINARGLPRIAILAALPIIMIIVQPSLGVAVLTAIGFAGILLASNVNKKILAALFAVALLLSPLAWFAMQPYQRQRINSFLSPASDPSGAGYNSMQAMISVGSGMIWGRGLGKGVQTQLLFLPEKHTDFIFASIAEELGFIGAITLMLVVFFLLYTITRSAENAINPTARAFITAIFLSFMAQVFIHIGMNMGLLPITGVPLPLVSAGGSSLVATMAALGMVVGATKER